MITELSNVNNRYLISAISDINIFTPYIDIPDELTTPLKVRLIDYNNYDLNQLSLNLFESYCLENTIKINRKTRYTTDLVIYSVSLDSMDSVRILEEFESLYSLEPMPSFELTLDTTMKENPLPVKIKDNKKDYPIVGILDSGIATNKYLAPWIEPHKHSNYPDDYVNRSHGTFVAGIIAYEDELEERPPEGYGGINLFDATVYPDTQKTRIYQDELIEHIREAIEQNADKIKIWNMSLGTVLEADLFSFSEFGMALDNIQDENNVLIVKSAGNCTNFKSNLPKSRIAQSADSIRSLVVGSISGEKHIYDLVDTNMPSPFTRVGPGPSYIVKPDLVHVGGSVGLHNGRFIFHGVPSLSQNGDIIRDCGTSFSTPRVSRIASELEYSMNEEFDSLMIKALLIHSAKYPQNSNMDMSEKVRQMGYGVPENVRSILFNSPNEITLVLRDTLERGNFIEMFDFPFPKKLVDERGYFRGQVILTLVNNPIVKSSQASEYCQSDLEIAFGTYQYIQDRDITKPIIKNQYGRDETSKNILNQACYSRRVFSRKNGDLFGKERCLIQYGKKFHPVKKYAIDLSDMTPANKEQWLKSDRKWYLKITGLYRAFVENEAAKNKSDLYQDFCMILTIRDPDNECTVYDDVSQLLDINNFIHYNIELRSDVMVYNAMDAEE